MDKLGRKGLWTMTALIGFIAIMIFAPDMDPTKVGFGLAIILSPTSAANAMEHVAKAKRG